MSSSSQPGTSVKLQQPRNPEPPPGSSPARRFRLNHPTAWIVLLLSLGASLASWLVVRNHAELTAQKRFDEEANRIAATLGERMLVYQSVLHGAAGLFASSYSVEREEWKAYIESISIERRFPGIDGLGFIASVHRDELDRFIQATRADKMPDFEVTSTGQSSVVFIIKYIEPQGRHAELLGRDIGSDPLRRAVAEEARDKGEVAISAGLDLSGPRGKKHDGFLMMLPVYRNHQPRGTVLQRRASIEGWVFARFLTAQLMEGIQAHEFPTIYFTVLDATPGTAEDMIYQNAAPPPGYVSKFTNEIFFNASGRQWRLIFAAKPAFSATIPKAASVLTAAAGVLLSLMLFGMVWSLSTTRERAVDIASQMTAALRSANERLEYERYLLQALMDNLPDCIYFKDTQNRFLRSNRAHLKLFGVQDSTQVIGKTDFAFFTEEHARQASDDENEIMRTGEPITKEEKETWPDGAVTWALSTKMPLRDQNGQIVGTFGISRDITDRKRAEEAMLHAKETAEDASRTKSQFLASMSHELRTPLNSIIGFANILLKNKSGTLAPADLNFLDRIQANGKHLLGLINQILDLSKIEARKLELTLSQVSLDRLIRDTISQEEGLIRDSPVELLADLPQQIAPILTDEDKLKQILINLIGNALKFTDRGNVTIRVFTDPATHQPLRIEVSDTGIGIPKEKLDVIFEAFHQAEAGTARKYGGSGLGLTISQALCRLLNYRIEAASQPGLGSTFAIVLQPCPPTGQSPSSPSTSPRPAPLPAPAPSPSKSPADLSGKIVLVIDDEADSRTLLTHTIEEVGCHVISANSGELGLLMARKLRPHLITTDLLMPGLDGWQVLRALKSDPDLRSIPVVIISVVAAENRGRIFGAVEILQKPVSRDDLIAALRRCFLPPKPRLLVVDDDADSRRLLTASLADQVAEVRTAANGQEALDLLDHFTPDAVLLDLLMPVMDGLAFLNAIRTDPRLQHLPVLVITARDLSPEESEFLRQETLAVLKKAGAFEQDLKRLLHKLLTRPPPVAIPQPPKSPSPNQNVSPDHLRPHRG